MMKFWLYSNGNKNLAFQSKKDAEEWAQTKPDPKANITEHVIQTTASLQPPVTRTVVRAADHSEFVPQRGGKPDCVIASLATATGIGYEQVADALGIELKDGIPDITGGINDFSVLGPLFKMGWSSCPLIPAELDDQVDGTSAKQLSRDDIRELLKGHPAIIGYHDTGASFHTVAWNGTEAVDCTDGLIIDLSDLPFQHAIVLTKI